MSSLWGPSRRDEVHLLSALESLGSTSLAGLSAALSWSERKTERCLREVVASGAAPLRYNAAQRTVEWVTRTRELATTVATPAPRSSAAPPVPPPPLPTGVRGSPRPAGTPQPPVNPPAPSLGSAARCPVCHANLTSTGSAAHGYCNKCGRLVTLQRSAPAAPTTPAPPASAPSTPPTAPPPSGADRKSQEMFAAWVTARPVPCPRCRTPMGHHGLAEYSCPSCGEKVTFPRPQLPSGPLRPAAAEAAPPTPPGAPSPPPSS